MENPQKSDVVELVVAYARQETVEPLRGAGRWILWGLISMTFVAFGMVIFSLGLLRLTQDLGNSAFDGAFSWAPYGIAMLFSAVIVAFAISQIRRSRL